MNTTDTVSYINNNGGIFKNFFLFIKYCLFRILVKLRFKPWIIFKKIHKHYDVAISYSQNDFSPYYIIDKINAEKKILWYHNGAYDKPEKNYIIDKEYYSAYDYIVAVSNDCKNMLQSKFRFNSEKIIVLKNFCDIKTIKEKSEEFNPSFNKNMHHIVTVGRLTKEKGADLAIEVCNHLKNEDIFFCWHWIGDGNMRSSIQEKISNYNLKSYFLLEGNQVNPYPYIKNCDIYVQPSYYEAYSTTITEAKILKKPIVTTDVGGMKEQLINNVNSFIVPIDSKSIAQAIMHLIKNKKICDSFSDNLSYEEYNMDQLFTEYEKMFFI